MAERMWQILLRPDLMIHTVSKTSLLAGIANYLSGEGLVDECWLIMRERRGLLFVMGKGLCSDNMAN